MRVAVAGGTGVVGKHAVHALRTAGHEPVVLTRSTGVDLLTGHGLDEALDGVGAVIDVVNKVTVNAAHSREFFERTTTQLLAAGARAGVAHHVALSIVGIDDVDYGYYMGKRRQEELVLESDAPVTVLRATQFHEFPRQLIATQPGPVYVIPRMRIQPVAAREVGAALAELAVGPAQGRAPDLGGPHEESPAAMARRILQQARLRRAVMTIPFPGAAGKQIAAGLLLPRDGRRGTMTFDEWLAGPDGPRRMPTRRQRLRELRNIDVAE